MSRCNLVDFWTNNKLSKFLRFMYIIKINKNLKFKKGVGITIKSKETSSKLAI